MGVQGVGRGGGGPGGGWVGVAGSKGGLGRGGGGPGWVVGVHVVGG